MIKAVKEAAYIVENIDEEIKGLRSGLWKYRRTAQLRKLLTLVRRSRRTERLRIKVQKRRDLLARRTRSQTNPRYLPQEGRCYKMFLRAKSISTRRIRPTVGDAGVRGIRCMNAMLRKQSEEQSSLVGERQPC
jgi:hypothetical protein